jgi:hypothetical protein
MINIRERIKLIQTLLCDGSIQGATYASLECRSTIEAMCYERFLIVNSHLASADLKKWQPRDVIKQVIEDANAESAMQLKISIAKPQKTINAGYVAPEDLEYVELGMQSELRYVALGRLHNSLSNVALHVQIPELGKPLNIYGDLETIRRKVEEALTELELAATGNMLIGSREMDCNFDCGCGSPIKRKAALLREGQVVSCANPDCKESYVFSLERGEAWFTRRAYIIPCSACAGELDIPFRFINSLKPDSILNVECHRCSATTQFRWTLSMTKPAVETDIEKSA